MGRFDEEWVREAERLHQRYLVEIVEAFELCPWALRARLAMQTHVAIVLAADEESAAGSCLAVLDRLAANDIQIGFLVFPRFQLRRPEFDAFVARLRSVDSNRHDLGGAPFALATFHPDAEPNLHDPERLVPFLRRTPDACIQAVSMAALERVRRGSPMGTQFVDLAAVEASLSQSTGATPTLRDRISRANLETVRRVGVGVLKERLESIQRDRARTYHALEEREASGAPRGLWIAPVRSGEAES